MFSARTSAALTTAFTAAVSALVATGLVFVSNTAFAQKSVPVVHSSSATLHTAGYDANFPYFTCDNYNSFEDLAQSNTYQKSDWDMIFVQNVTTSAQPIHQLTDLNGDGLADYVFAYSYVTTGSTTAYNFYSCIYLNTGSGFEPAYRCHSEVREVSNVITAQNYYGDCAG